jgi:hypothetical protein
VTWVVLNAKAVAGAARLTCARWRAADAVGRASVPTDGLRAERHALRLLTWFVPVLSSKHGVAMLPSAVRQIRASTLQAAGNPRCA